MSADNQPSDLCIVLCSAPAAHEDGWINADRVAGQLKRLGFKCSTQQVAAWLKRLARMDAPPIEVGIGWDQRVYRITSHGATWLHNKLPGVWYAQASMRDQQRRTAAARAEIHEQDREANPNG